MNGREKLKMLLATFKDKPETTCSKPDDVSCEGCPYDVDDGCDMISRFADYLISNGIVAPRCKVGDTIYRVHPIRNEIVDWVIIEIIVTEDEIAYIDDSDNLIKDEDFGKTVFLSKETAEGSIHERK